MIDQVHHLSLKRVRAQAWSLRHKAAKSDWSAADKRKVLALTDALLAAIPALEDPAPHKGNAEALALDFVSNFATLEMLVDRLDEANNSSSPEAIAARARKTFKRERPSLSGGWWGHDYDEWGREPYDDLDHPGGDDRGERPERSIRRSTTTASIPSATMTNTTKPAKHPPRSPKPSPGASILDLGAPNCGGQKTRPKVL